MSGGGEGGGGGGEEKILQSVCKLEGMYVAICHLPSQYFAYNIDAVLICMWPLTKFTKYF